MSIRKTSIVKNNKDSFNSSDKEISPTFCVARLKNGKVIRIEGMVKDFLPLIKRADIIWINIAVDNLEGEAQRVTSMFGFAPLMVKKLLSQKFSGCDDLTTELGLLVPAVKVYGVNIEINKLLVILKHNFIITMHGKDVTRLVKFARYSINFFKKLPEGLNTSDKLSLVLCRILEENNEKNFDGIRQIQEQGEEISRYLIQPTLGSGAELGKKIYKMKHVLLTYLETLWATLEVVYFLRYGDAELITDDRAILQKVKMLSNDLTRQISLSEQMSTVLASGLEVLQSIYNNQLQLLNNRLSLMITWLTIFGTAVLVPNTIATIFGIAPIAEHIEWHTMIWIIALSTIASIALVYWWFVKQKVLAQPEIHRGK